jgi:hypothetical protein
VSLENAGAFAKLIFENEALRRKVAEVKAGKSQPEAAAAVCALAASAGYEFTPEEGRAVSQQIVAGLQPAGSGQLGEDVLDSVAGGLTAGFTNTQTTYVSQNVNTVVSMTAPTGTGGASGSIFSGFVQGYMNNSNPNQSQTGNGFIGAGQAFNDFGEGVRNFFGSIFGS